MDTAKHLLPLTVAIIFTLQAPVSDAPRTTVDPAASLHTMTTLSVEQNTMIQHSLDLYEEAGLRLPGIDFVGYDDTSMCNDRDGLAVRSERRTEIRLCTRETGLWQKRIVLHEMAHAWDHHMLDEPGREALTEIRTMKGWRDGEWHERGAEQAAEIITWGVIDQPIRIIHLNENSCQELHDGYVALTGEEPPHETTDLCD